MRQKVMSLLYPVIMWFSRVLRPATHVQLAKSGTQPSVSFYELEAKETGGHTLDFATLKGRWVIIVNTASYCGYTHQLSELTDLQKHHPNELSILAFPSNDFKNQEPQSDEEIARFCSLQYGTPYTLMQKSAVLPGGDQHPVYQWLTKAAKNGWCDQPPIWNFCKYLVSPEGKLTGFLRRV